MGIQATYVYSFFFLNLNEHEGVKKRKKKKKGVSRTTEISAEVSGGIKSTEAIGLTD